MMRTDPITRQVIANRLEAIPKEMTEIIRRTARSTVIVHGKDFSCGLLDARAQLLATPEGAPVHIFPVVAGVEFIQKKFGSDIHPGDMFFGNDFSEGGSHLNDVLLCVPLFIEEQLVSFIAVRGHLVDVGGMSPGSITGAAREIFQEGMRVPMIKLYDKGTLNKSIWEMFMFNVRMPEVNDGDMKALLAGVWTGEKRLREMFERYGKDVVLTALDEIHNAAERVMRNRIRDLPDGTYTHEEYVDNDGVTSDPRMIRVSAQISGDSITIDLDGSAEQSAGPMNMGYGVSTGYSLMSVKVVLDPGAQVKHGSLRPITVKLPANSMVNAQPPAAVGSTGTTGALVAIGMGALAQIMPKSVTAGENTTGNHFNFSGFTMRDGKPERFIYYDYPAGGGGGRFGLDGIDATGSLRTGNVDIQSIEALESAYPALLFKRWMLWTSSGGPGEYRGGHGQIREYEAGENGSLSILLSQCMVPAGGMLGGYPAARNGCKVIRNGTEISLGDAPYWGKASDFPIKKGDLIRMEMSGGGGYGDPLDRSVAQIALDLQQGMVTPEQARGVYGVVFDPITFVMDEPATQTARSLIRQRRIFYKTTAGQQPVYDRGVRRVLTNPDLGRKGIQDGGMVELIGSGHPCPLRVRVNFSTGVAVEDVQIDEEARNFYNIEPGTPLELRLLLSIAASATPPKEIAHD